MNSENIFAFRVKQLRIANNLTQQQLGEVIGLSKQAINDIEQGRRETTITKSISMARLFNTTVHYLVGDTDDPTRPSDQSFVEMLFSDDSDFPLALRLRELQAEKKVTWETIANVLESSIENTESNSPLTPFLALADYFDVSLDYLVGRSEVKERR